MSSQDNTMDAEEYENWIEQHLTDVAECGAGKMCEKARWEINKARKASELESLSFNTTNESIEPLEIEWETSLVKEGYSREFSEDKGVRQDDGRGQFGGSYACTQGVTHNTEG